MLSLQMHAKAGWVPVEQPYPATDTQRVQQAAVVLANATGAVWRVVGSDSQVAALWDGRRWHTTAPAQWVGDAAAAPAPAPFWRQDPGFESTIPAADGRGKGL